MTYDDICRLLKRSSLPLSSSIKPFYSNPPSTNYQSQQILYPNTTTQSICPPQTFPLVPSPTTTTSRAPARVKSPSRVTVLPSRLPNTTMVATRSSSSRRTKTKLSTRPTSSTSGLVGLRRRQEHTLSRVMMWMI